IKYEIISSTSILYGGSLSFAIGVDRLLSVLFPIKYRNINKFYYLSTIILMCSIYSFGVMAVTYLTKDENMLVLCGPNTVFTGFMTIGFLYAQGLCFSLAIVTYISIWISLKYKKDQILLLKPISIILGFIVGGWIF